MLRDSMKKGDTAFFYHSSCDVPGIAGIVRVVKEGYPDETAFDPKHHHYDAESDEANRAGSSWTSSWCASSSASSRSMSCASMRASELSDFVDAAARESSVGHAGVEGGVGFRSHSRVRSLTSLPHCRCKKGDVLLVN